MPSELQRVAQGLVEVLDQVPRVVAYLHETARKCRENAALIGGMTSNPNARMAAMQLDEAARRCEEAAHYASIAPQKARAWAEQMVCGGRVAGPGGGGSPAPRPVGPGGSGPTAERRQNDGQEKPEAAKPREGGTAGDDESPKDAVPPGRRITDEEGHRLQQTLPNREDSGLTQPKTRGKWVNENGDEEDLVSGQHDEWFQKATGFLRERGIPPRNGDSITTPSHVETKFAMRMRLQGRKHETIMVNKLPCPGKWGCRALIGLILPPGSTLTVFGPDGFKKTYPVPTSQERSNDE